MVVSKERVAPRANLSFGCRCGLVAGMLIEPGPIAGDHVVCHCTDCQTFAKRFNAADRILDQHAGTALYQGRCSTMRLIRGRHLLACVHLTEKPTLRWYARCCNTPMFNTFKNGRIPYITTVVANCDQDQRSRLLGPPIGHLFTEEGIGDVSRLRRLSILRLMRRFSTRMIIDILVGDRRRADLFDPGTLQPIASPDPRAPRA